MMRNETLTLRLTRPWAWRYACHPGARRAQGTIILV